MPNLPRAVRPILFALLALTLCLPALAWQTASTGQIVGNVVDPSGAAIPGATLTVTERTTGTARTVSANGSGHYVAPLLPPGSYTITVRATGFAPRTAGNITVPAATTTTVNLQLSLGANQQQVTVESGAELLQTENAANGSTTDQMMVTALPLTARNYTEILQLAPGVASSLPNAASLGKGTVDVNVNGARVSDNSYQIDGEDASNLQVQGSAGILAESGISIPNPDSIEEFRVQTGEYDATFGRGAGANVDVVTKSGTNQFHGDLFEFLRNTALDANDFFLNSTGQPRPLLRQNQFGGTFGGPLIKNKLLFFASYQGTRQTNGQGSTSLQSVKLPLLSADASGRTAAALGTEFQGLAGLQGGEKIAADGSNINPVAVALLNAKLPDGSFLIPAPQVVQNAANVSTGGFSTFSLPSTFKENQLLGNLDYTPSSKQRLTEKFFWARDDTNSAFSTGDLPGAPTFNVNENSNLALQYTYIFAPNLINVASVGYHRIFGQVQSQYPITNQQIGMTPDCSSMPIAPIISVSGSFSLGGTFNDGQWADTRAYQAGDQWTWIKGAHNMRFGGDVETTKLPFADPETTRGTLGFSSVPDFLLGLSAKQNGSAFSNLSSARSLCGDAQKEFQETDYDGYFQDDYHVAKNLTVNLGVRWDVMGQVSDTQGKFAAFWPQLATNAFPASGNLYTGFVVPANFSGPVPAGVATNTNNTFAVNPTEYGSVGPRVGFSWQMRPKIVLRGGYGIYYGRTSANDAYQFVGDQPFEISQTNSGTLAALATFQNPWPPSAPPLASDYPTFVPRTPTSQLTLNLPGPYWHPPTVQQYSVNVQYALSGSTMVQVGYVGTKSNHIEGTQNIDQALLTVNPNSPGAATFTGPSTSASNIQSRRPILGFSSISLAQEIFLANYNALQFSAERRLTRGLQVQVSYTYSKNLTDDTGNGTFPGTGGTSGDASNPINAYGPASFDIPQRLVGNFVWQVPGFGMRGVEKSILGGWAMSGVVTLQSGTPMTFSDTKFTNIYGGSARAQMCPGASYASILTPGSIESKLNNYWNINAVNCAPPAIGNGFSWGSSGTGVVLGPGERDADFSITRSFPVPGPTEGTTLQFRGEFYNALNIPNFSAPSTSAASSSFGQITSTSLAPRLIQFGFKYIF
ncbi:MAG TPA: TonB-dependent receptor [Terriglobales bacterium]|nr:TonB-dependent receptor [Terriglobales bacterium]